ncbi:hypothetical protein [Chelativorans sp. M5D2P16]|uniref:hypothetical protein n=1 Tax=Chelativorans sp. M5D2P16 TaxID=3095678 RepID=UPI002ACA1DE4|nr:hypothetical protein [Chelativorans sp. M5D2P16]MDZ5695956.1 hypothetical protein [Chelativorans sp. M5D2P16]
MKSIFDDRRLLHQPQRRCCTFPSHPGQAARAIVTREPGKRNRPGAEPTRVSGTAAAVCRMQCGNFLTAGREERARDNREV